MTTPLLQVSDLHAGYGRAEVLTGLLYVSGDSRDMAQQNELGDAALAEEVQEGDGRGELDGGVLGGVARSLRRKHRRHRAQAD